MHNSDAPNTVPRRTLMEGAAWSIPVIAVAAATAPAFAASQFTCPPVPENSAWVETSTGPSNSAPYYWTGTGTSRAFEYFKDSSSASLTYQLKLSAPLSVVNGRTYRISYAIQTADGCGPGGATVNANFDAFVAGTKIGGRSTKAGYGNVVQSPPPCPTGWGPAQTISFDYVATSTGTIQLEMYFTSAPTTLSNGDDIRIVPSIVCL